MERQQVLQEIKRYFDVDELVCNHTYEKWKEASWQFLDTAFLQTLLVIRRDIIKRPMYCNGNNAKQRGLRCNMCQLVREKRQVYLSAHVLGKAGDFTIAGMSAEQARQAIKAAQGLLPYPVRMEEGVSWLHFDVLPQYGVTARVYGFKA